VIPETIYEYGPLPNLKIMKTKHNFTSNQCGFTQLHKQSMWFYTPVIVTTRQSRSSLLTQDHATIVAIYFIEHIVCKSRILKYTKKAGEYSEKK
jgi:hypothetical protein